MIHLNLFAKKGSENARVLNMPRLHTVTNTSKCYKYVRAMPKYAEIYLKMPE